MGDKQRDREQEKEQEEASKQPAMRFDRLNVKLLN